MFTPNIRLTPSTDGSVPRTERITPQPSPTAVSARTSLVVTPPSVQKDNMMVTANAAVRHFINVRGTAPMQIPADIAVRFCDTAAIREGLAILCRVYECSASVEPDRDYERGLRLCEDCMQDRLEDEFPLFHAIHHHKRTRVQKTTRVIFNFGLRLGCRGEPQKADPTLAVTHRLFTHATAMLRVLLDCAHTGVYTNFTSAPLPTEWDTWLPSEEQDIADAALRKLDADVEVLRAQVMLPICRAMGPVSKEDTSDHTKSKTRFGHEHNDSATVGNQLDLGPKAIFCEAGKGLAGPAAGS
jgi:hypothetical protein